MVFQEFFKNCLKFVMVQSLSHFIIFTIRITLVIFTLGFNDLNESAKLSSGSSLQYCHKLSRCFWIIIAIIYQIIHWHYYINILSIMYFCIVYFTFAISKWSAFFKYYYFISFICLSSCSIISCSSNCYYSFSKYLRITMIM